VIVSCRTTFYVIAQEKSDDSRLIFVFKVKMAELAAGTAAPAIQMCLGGNGFMKRHTLHEVNKLNSKTAVT
jgi:S-ribosylhomocysteine lyase LuxS involved in autoinducer biosynthesis